jgi:hypothetical protein
VRQLSIITILIVFSLIFSGCGQKTDDQLNNQSNNDNSNARLLINALEKPKRPFVAIVPNSSAKFLTLYLDKVDSAVKSASLDIEYLSGTSLKGGRVTPSFPLKLPHAQAFLLGSCSTGGKCSFDKDLISGTIKTRLDFSNGQGHVLKSEYVFVNGAVSTPDGRVNYTPKNLKTKDQILVDTQGYPGEINVETIYNPIVISSAVSGKIQGNLKFNVSGATSVLIFDGRSYQKQTAKISTDSVEISLNHDPWFKKADITRDDLKGSSESVDLYLLGPIILTK